MFGEIHWVLPQTAPAPPVDYPSTKASLDPADVQYLLFAVASDSPVLSHQTCESPA
jgi:hypothetical protein